MLTALALTLSGCNPAETTPQNDTLWNPEDLMESLEDQGGVLEFDSVNTPSSDFEHHYYYDTRNLGITDDNITLRNAEFIDKQDLYCVTRTDSDNNMYDDCDLTLLGQMSFEFLSNLTGEHCELKIKRSASLFDEDADWTFRFQSENPHCIEGNDLPNCQDEFACDGELEVTKAVESLNSEINY